MGEQVMSSARDRVGGATVIEVRSIDYVPERERHGKVWHQGPFWFMGNFVLVTMVTGFLGPILGLNLGWSALAILLGGAFGTFFMAFHAVQGPRMGLPQMIQSRPQFGLRGAVFPFAAVVFVYIGFNVFDTVVAAQGFDTVLNASNWIWYSAITVVALALAVYGHDMLHLVQRTLTYISVVVFGIFTIGALFTLHLGTVAARGGFSWTGFLIMFSAVTGYNISYAPYVSDYSRYLPANTPARSVVWWVFTGAVLPTYWLMTLGALLGAALPNASAIGAIRAVGDKVFPGFGLLTVLVAIPALITVMGVNNYGAMLTSASAVDGFRQVRPSVRLRVIGVVIVALIGFVIALALPSHYLSSFNNFVLFMLYFLIPWTAVNLVDFYFVRRGHYAITEIFNPDGFYRRWGWQGLVSYFVGLGVMVPFMSTSIYTGPIAHAMNGVDISFAIGLPVAAGLYYVLTRNLDLPAEREAESASRRVLEGEGSVSP